MNKTKHKVTLSKLTFHKLDWLEYVTIGMSVWFIFFREPYTLLFTCLLCIPILGLVLNGLTGRPSIASLVAISTNAEGNDEYDVADFIDLAAWALVARVMLDFEFESFYSLIIPGAITFVGVVVLLFATHSTVYQTRKSKTWIVLSLLFNLFLYSYAATYGVNCVYDQSKPEVYHAEVLNKRISKSRKHTSYYVEVTPWGHHHDKEEISVTEKQYWDIQIGQTVRIDYKKGLLNIPWYYIET